MANVKAILIAGAFMFGAANAAGAADLLPPPPAPPEILPEMNGWYLRGDLGASIDQLSHFYSTDAPIVGGYSFEGAGLSQQADIGAGVGYRLNNWVRFDVTGEYRTDAKYWALENYTAACGIGTCYDGYKGRLGTIDTMVNGYVDLGTWWNLTPFVGGGVGVAFNRFGDLTDLNYSVISGSGSAPNNWNTTLAWNVQAGIDYAFLPNWALEFSYRYFDGGTVKSAAFNCGGGCTSEVQSFHFNSNDIRLGLRYTFAEAPPPAPPLITKY
jgi:opacity protein-like surface antigen